MEEGEELAILINQLGSARQFYATSPITLDSLGGWMQRICIKDFFDVVRFKCDVVVEKYNNVSPRCIYPYVPCTRETSYVSTSQILQLNELSSEHFAHSTK
jgi:hypothetical protein